MKANQLFEKAKQAVAEKHLFVNWEYGIFVSDHDTVKALYQEAAEWMCNEAVKADRKQIAEDFDSNELEYKGNVVDHLSYINHCFPLPFPQQPDGL